MDESDKWSQRRLRHCVQYGIRPDIHAEEIYSISKNGEASITNEKDNSTKRPPMHSMRSIKSTATALSRTRSLDRTHINRDCFLEKRESILGMACRGLNSVVTGDLFRQIQEVNSSKKNTVTRISTCVSIRDRDRLPGVFSSFPSNQKGYRCDSSLYRNNTTTNTCLLADVEHSHGDLEHTKSSNLMSNNSHKQNITEQMDLDDEDLNGILFIDIPNKTNSSIDNNDRQEITSSLSPDLCQISNQNGNIHETEFNFTKRRITNDSIENRRRKRLPIYGQYISDPLLIVKLKDYSYDYRPCFTYWISTVHVFVLLFMILNFGIGTDFLNILYNPFGVIERSGNVMTSSLSAAHIVVWEQNNIWIGPKYSDLVHVGAKYTPCMRRDQKIYEQILNERRIESETTGCCVGPWGCYQTSECPKQFAQHIKWINGTFPERPNFRVACGQDPRYCVKPRSVHPFLWGIDLIDWPICEQKASSIPPTVKHMNCEITGRPCCIQMHGQCRITSREYCDFVGGYYHPNAVLCSQVSCLREVCGLTSFLRKDSPDHIYRLITPLFIHAGIIRCAISLAIYLTVMRRFEIMIGWHRLSAIYFISGIGGYLASAVFVPYMPEVGPAGSEGGVLGALIVHILYSWSWLNQPFRVLFLHLAIAFGLFILGFLPWIDNWAQVAGFLFGSLTAIILLPYITIGSGRVRKRRPLVAASFLILAFMFSILFALFFFYQIDYEPLALLNCPIPTKICDHQGLILRDWIPI
uniref:Rhomboid domain-containing protein n=1 Tax=Meloidogyne hapla TaxID=6305 RepID=A0A1I8C0E9_MELHA